MLQVPKETIVGPQLEIENVENQEAAHYNVHTNAKNIKLPGPIWGLHTDNFGKILFTYVEELSNDKCFKFITPNTATVSIKHLTMYLKLFNNLIFFKIV